MWVAKINREILSGRNSVAAFKEVVDRLEGKAVARVEMSGPAAGPLVDIDEIRSRLYAKLLPELQQEREEKSRLQ